MRPARPARERRHRSRVRRRGHGRRRQHHARSLERSRLPHGRPLAPQGRRGGPATGREVLPHRFLRGPVRGLRGARRAAGRARRAGPEGGAVQLGGGGRGERRQVRQGRDGPARGDLLRGGVPWSDAAHHESDQPAHAVQARVRPVRGGGVPGAVQLPVPRRRSERPVGPCGRRASLHDGRRPERGGRGHLRARAGRGRLRRPGTGVPAGGRGVVSPTTASSRSPTRSSPDPGARAGSSRASTSGWTPTS